MNFDVQTTEEWLLAAFISATVGWVTEPVKGAVLAAVLVIISKEKKKSFKQAGRMTADGITIRWRDCHSANALFPSLLVHVLQVDWGAAE